MAGLQVVINPSNTEIDADVIAVHGLNGNEKDTWELNGDIDHSPLAEEWFRYFGRPRICTYGYNIASDSSNLFVRQGLRDEATRLLNALTKLRNDGPKAGNNNANFTLTEDFIYAMVCLVEDVNLQFLATGLQYRVALANVSSVSEQLKESIFLENETTLAMINMSDMTRRRKHVVTDNSHIRIAQDSLPRPLNVRWDEMVDYVADIDYPVERLMLPHKSIIDLQLCKTACLTNTEDAIFQNDKYLNWMKRSGIALLTIQGLEDTERMTSAIVRHLDRSASNNLTLACKYTGKIHPSNWISRLLFTSSIFGDDYAPTKEALEEFWIQIKDLAGPSPQQILHLWRKTLLSYNGNTFWVLQDVDSVLEALRELFGSLAVLGASSEPRLKIIIVAKTEVKIQVDSLPSEIIKIKETQNSSQPTEKLQRAQCEPESHGSKITSLAKRGDTESSISGKENLKLFDEETEVLKLVLQRPQLYTSQSIIRRRLSQCHEPAIREANLHWLRSLDSKLVSSEIERLVSNSFLLNSMESPSVIFKRIMNSLRFKNIAEQILEFMLHSFRSLTVGELSDLIISESIRQESEATSWSYILSESGLFPVILVISHDRVQFSQECFRQLAFSHMRNSHTDHLDEKTTALSHYRIAAICVGYIQSAHRGNLNQGRTVDKGQHHEFHTEFLSYAAIYWPNHSKLAGDSVSPEIEPFKTFIEQQDSLEYWVNVYRDNLGSLEAEPEKVSLVSPLSIFTESGLENMLSGTILHFQNMPNLSKKCLFALELAAKNGHFQIIQRLLMSNFDGEAALDKAIALSIGWQHTDAAISLVRYAYNAPRRLTNPSKALSGAILMGMSEVVSLLISLMVDNDQNYEGIDLFRVAGISGRVEIALDHGHYELLHFLVNREFVNFNITQNPQQLKDEIEQDTRSIHGDINSEDFRDLLRRAAILGQFKILESLLMIAESRDKEYRNFLVEIIELSIQHRQRKCFEVSNQAILKLDQPDESGYGFDTFSLMQIAVHNADINMFQKMLDLHWPFDKSSLEYLFKKEVGSMEETDGSLDLLKILLDRAKEIFSHQNLGYTLANALSQAAINDRKTIARWLIESGASVDLAFEFTWVFESSPVTCLFYAVYLGKLNLVTLLLEAKANPNADSGHPKGWKALHAAYDSVEVTRLLIGFKADINSKTEDGKTPLFLALEKGFFETAKELLKHGPELNISIEGDTELSLALKSSSKEAGDIFNTLVDAGANPFLHSTADISHPFLHSCVRSSNLEVLKRLLLLNFSLEDDETKDTALNSIASATETSVIDLLVKRGASIFTRNENGYTPLVIAVKEGNIEVTKYLISLGANINDATDKTNTPIHISCLYGDLEMVELLLEKGADVNEASNDILGTPFQAALLREPKDPAIITYLLKHKEFEPNQKSSWWGCNLNLACLSADIEVVNELLELKATVEVEDHVGRSPIHFALYRTVEHIKRITEAYSKDTDPLAAKDHMRRNALHFAVVSGRLDVVHHVLKEHADFVNEVDIDDWTPLLWAIRDCALWDTESDQKAAIIDELLGHGASLLVKGRGSDRDWTPLTLAKYYGLGNEIEEKLKPSVAIVNSSPDKNLWEKLLNEKHGFKKGLKVNGYCDACLMLPEDSESERTSGSMLDERNEILEDGDEASEGVVDVDEYFEEY
ncbi:hypothetical protein BOTCAL_0298g00130 [Botryotinia calthae]|uniref:Uncharacterized protein n=1 Tax=Botryotinia calthae TaxID=38488 RepID=A0A4Y8CVB9_9HELO|nr:hypothetical protein BOTCAL_0298g00130 [Botryotinia calthae]